jgi:hypothetical protein|tara:strand:- start:3285 stop:3806 length:522 start_codon:yes stop_codon:yes gene_type:complete
MPEVAHSAKRKAILWHHASSTHRIERVELVSLESQSGSAAASLKMIIDSVEAIAKDTFNETETTGGSKASLRHFLNQLSISEVKAVHFIIQAGRTPSWLRGSSSIESLYLDLNGIESEERNRQIYIDFLVSTIDRLPTYIASYSEICGERYLDPFDELGALVQKDSAHSRSSD